MTLSIRSHTTFQGPSGWDQSPVIHLIVDTSAMGNVPQFTPNLAGWYAEFAELVAVGTSLEPIIRAEPDNLGAMVAEIALNLQRIAGVSVDYTYGRRRSIDDGYDVVVQYRHRPVGMYVARFAVGWLSHLLGPDTSTFDPITEFGRLTSLISTNDHGVDGRALAEAAERRGIPLSLVDPRGRVVELGNGRYRQRIFAHMTSQTSAIGRQIARDKHLTNSYLREAGLPVPDSMVVRSIPAALAAARSIGYPVVIKPHDLGDSIGVALDLRSDDDIRASFDAVAKSAATSDGLIVVERFIPGNDYRVLIVNDAIVAVSRRLHPQVIGDGEHSIRELIEIENANPRRGTRASDVYKKILIDEHVLENLARMELSLEDVPPSGQEIVLKKSGHRRDGAIHVDLTDEIHPVNANLMRTATRVLGLDFAGIDVVTPDISRSLWDVGGAIIEINEGPAFNLHLFPGAGTAHDPGPAIMEMLFPLGQPVRASVIAVAAQEEAASIGYFIASAASQAGQAVGLATTAGLTIDGIPYPGVEARNPAGPRTLLNNPNVELAVVEVDAQSIVDHGLGFDVCDVAVIRSLSGAKTPYGHPVETVLIGALEANGTLLLNALDPSVRALAEHWPGSLLFVDTEEAAISAAIQHLRDRPKS